MTEPLPNAAPAARGPASELPRGHSPQRAADIATLTSTTWDVVIVGGGIVGSGALLDAVSRGLRAALIEQDDIAAGTSSRSSRLIHGGLRYLEQFRFGLVREALDERSTGCWRSRPISSGSSPSCSRSTGMPYLSKAFYDAGLTLYDVLGARHDGGWHQAAFEGRDAGARPRRSARRGCAAACSTTTGWRTTLVTRWPWLGRPSPREAWRSPGSVLRERAPSGSGGDRGASSDRPGDRATTSRSRPRRSSTRPGSGPPNPDTRSAGGSMRILPSRGAHLVVPRDRIPNKTGPHDPGAGQGRLPRPVARSLADRHDRRPVRGSRRPTGRGRLGGRQAPRHGQRDDGRRPDP